MIARKRWKQESKSSSNGAHRAQGQRRAGGCYGVQDCMGGVGRSTALPERLLINYKQPHNLTKALHGQQGKLVSAPLSHLSPLTLPSSPNSGKFGLVPL